MKIPNGWHLLIFAILTMTIFNSCTRVTWAAFTTPKDNIENVPKALEQYLGSPPTHKIRIFEYDKDKYMGLFVQKNAGTPQAIDLAKTNRVNIIQQSDAKAPTGAGRIAAGSVVSGYQFIQYTPAAGEDEIITAFYLMEAVNKLKKNKKMEVYSQTNPDLTRQFTILNK